MLDEAQLVLHQLQYQLWMLLGFGILLYCIRLKLLANNTFICLRPSRQCWIQNLPLSADAGNEAAHGSSLKLTGNFCGLAEHAPCHHESIVDALSCQLRIALIRHALFSARVSRNAALMRTM